MLYLTIGAGVPLEGDENKKMVTEMIALEWGRFEAADRDKNGTLCKAEFKAAIFPHEYEYMVDQMVKVSIHLHFYLLLQNLPHKTHAYMFIHVRIHTYMCLFLQLHIYMPTLYFN